jgi:hypothetical protein
LEATITFDECEHSGDMFNYINDLITCGAKLISYSSNYHCETCNVLVEINDYKSFIIKFKETDSYELSSLNTY